MNGESHLEEGKTHLSEFIEHDYDKEIAPYRLISIVSGVGSGKNTMIDHLVDGDLFCHQDGTKVEKQAVLLITSRRAKANEQLSNKKHFMPEECMMMHLESGMRMRSMSRSIYLTCQE